MKIYNDITELIGNTKLFYVKNFCEKECITAKICLKLENLNPAGSIKDRAALYMIKKAEERGELKAGATIIEPTSGNTGIGLAAIGRARGYKVILTMPDTMSVERINLLKAYGAELILTPGKDGMKGAIAKAEALCAEIPGSKIMGQFDNPDNVLAHYETTGPEIWNDTDGLVAAFVAGVGTGGTFSGISKFLKEKNGDIRTVGVEPASSPMITKGVSGSHKLQGIGANFVPDNFKKEYCDEIIPITDEEAYLYGRKIAESEGILIGISAGSALAGAVKLAKSGDFDGKIIVAVSPDSGEHYLSVKDYLK